MTYVPKRKPWDHQQRGFDLSVDREFFAYFMEQRTGKTGLCLDVVCANYEAGRINALLVIAPSGVHRNWVVDEIPKIIPDRIDYKALFWRADRHGAGMDRAAEYRQKEKLKERIVDSHAYRAYRELKEVFAHPGLAIVAVGAEAFRLQNTRDFIKKFWTARKLFSAVDESTIIKAPGGKQSKLARTLGAHSVMRRILDGTPLAESPLDAYAQCRFLAPHGEALGFPTFALFKARYAEYAKKDIWVPGRQGGDARQIQIDDLVAYRNLDELQARLDSFSFRVLRRECFDIPPTLFRKRYVELTPKQRQIYERLDNESLLEVAGRDVSVKVVLTKYIRLQQVLSNFLPPPASRAIACGDCGGAGCLTCDETGVMFTQTARAARIDSKNPRCEALLDEILACKGQVIVWSRFTRDRDDIAAMLTEHDIPHCRYDGRVSDDEKYAAKGGFQDGRFRVISADPQSAGVGIDLSAAELSIYYNNRFSNRLRLQSQDRMESGVAIKQREVVDLVAADTVDETIVYSNLTKQKLSDLVMDDANRGRR